MRSEFSANQALQTKHKGENPYCLQARKTCYNGGHVAKLLNKVCGIVYSGNTCQAFYLRSDHAVNF